MPLINLVISLHVLRVGLEPTTNELNVRYSTHLSYLKRRIRTSQLLGAISYPKDNMAIAVGIEPTPCEVISLLFPIELLNLFVNQGIHSHSVQCTGVIV